MAYDETREGPAFPVEDLASYITDFEAGGLPVDSVTDVRCGQCRSTSFRATVDNTAGCVLRTCAFCGDERFIADSADYWDDAEPMTCVCPCGGEEFSIAVGFSRTEDGNVRWISVGMRCLRDGALGVYADWKIDYTPSAHLMDNV